MHTYICAIHMCAVVETYGRLVVYWRMILFLSPLNKTQAHVARVRFHTLGTIHRSLSLRYKDATCRRCAADKGKCLLAHI